MEMDVVSKAFEQAFVSVSQKLLGLQLQRRKQDKEIFLQQPVRQIMICMVVVCRRMNRFHCISKNILILFVDMVYPV